jgi:FMN phosphatase YigB (HAD superfamily)
MTTQPPLVVLDLGDVLVRTVPGAQYDQLQGLTGVPAALWARAADDGLTEALELGRIDFSVFAGRLCGRVAAGTPQLNEMRAAFCATVVELDPLVAEAARELARQDRLLIASNTSEPHWAVIQHLLAQAEITAPACLSFEIGHRKPSDGFFEVLADMDKRVRDHACFVDDRSEHVEAARRIGMEGVLHKTAQFTAAWLTAIARLGSF